jgi:hypothetical protein
MTAGICTHYFLERVHISLPTMMHDRLSFIQHVFFLVLQAERLRLKESCGAPCRRTSLSRPHSSAMASEIIIKKGCDDDAYLE